MGFVCVADVKDGEDELIIKEAEETLLKSYRVLTHSSVAYAHTYDDRLPYFSFYWIS